MGAVVAFAAVCCAGDVTHRIKEFYFLLNLMICGILGRLPRWICFSFTFSTNCSGADLHHDRRVGQGAERNYATYKITLYLSFGALLALIGLIGVYVQTGANLSASGFDESGGGEADHGIRATVDIPAADVWFGILVSLWPFHHGHRWVTVPHPATAMLHAGVLKKFGLYGLIRVAIRWRRRGANLARGVGVVGLGQPVVLWSGRCATEGFESIIGNSSVAHMGFIFWVSPA